MKRWLLFMSCLGILVAGSAVAQEPFFSWQPLVIEKLDNGLTVIVKEDKTRPLAITDIWFKVGSRNENDAINGVSHFLEHTLFKGTVKRGVGDIARDIEALGGRTNAATSMDFTHYYISCESDRLMQALEIHADVFRNSQLASAAIDKERGVILEEIKRGDDNPQRILWDTLMQTLFLSHPYHRTILGPRENIAKGISRDDMMKYFKTWYGPANMTILVVGAVDAKAVVAKIRELYGDWTGEKPPEAKFERDAEPKTVKVIRKEMDVDRGYLLMGYRSVPLATWEESIGLDVLGVILGSGRSSRLSMALKENKPLVTSISAGQMSLTDDGVFLVRTEYDPLDEDAVLTGIREEIRRLVREPVSPEELQKAKDYLENGYLRAIESVEGKADSLGSTLVRTDLEYEFKFLERMRSVTASQMQVLANKYLAGENYTLVMVGPKPRVASTSPSGDITKFVLDNGLRVIHRPMPGSGLVGMTLGLDAGSIREPDGQAGISNLTAEMMMKGTKRRDGTKILWDLERLGSEMSSGSEPDLVRFYLNASTRNFPQALEIFADVLRNPTFPEAAFAMEKTKLLMRLKSIGDDMFENTWRLFNATMYGKHPYSRHYLGERGDVERLTVKDLVGYHHKAYTPNHMVISVVGDLTASEALKLIFNTLGTMPPGQAWEKNEDALKVVQLKEGKEVRDNKEKNQAFVCFGWQAPRIGDPEYSRMKVLNAVLGGGMSARFFMNIRNKNSLAYAVNAMFPSRVHGGAMVAAIGTDPKAVAQVRDAVVKEVLDIAKNGVPAVELSRAIAYVSGQFALDHDTCLKNSSYMAWFETIGLGFAYDDQYLKEVKTVTSEELKTLAAKYLIPEKAILAVTGPAEGGKTLKE